jgi:undecaprenyl-diphosphatase
MNWWQMTVSAIVQGIAEFLPISSDGHLLIAQKLMGAKLDLLEVNVILHAGTLGSIVVVYWREIARLLGRDRRVIGLLALGTLPAAAAGLTLALLFKELVESVFVAGLSLPVTGLLLLWMKGKDGTRDYTELSWREALWIGVLQATALLPGISRSGTTIFGGLSLGLKRPAAATFSFLLAIPAILLASAYGTLKLWLQGGSSTPLPILAYGTALTFFVGVAALLALKRLLSRGQLHWFAWWCIPLGMAVAIWQWPLDFIQMQSPSNG